MDGLTVTCPHCGDMLEIIEKACCIFRHGILSPHASKVECDLYKGFGCGKPFRIIEINGKWIAMVCDYI